MKRYVRTKYAIFEISYEENGYLYTIDGEIGCEPSEIVDQADNIEELLDLYVVVDGNQVATYTNLELAKSIKGVLYGNILVDGVSNSVAKWNETTNRFELIKIVERSQKEYLDIIKQCCSNGLQLECSQSAEQVKLVSDALNQCDRIAAEYLEMKAIENKMGISLTTLYKALANGVWFENGKNNVICKKVCFSIDCFGGHFSTDFDFKYGLQGWDLRTNKQNIHWALTKEELKGDVDYE